jgi:Cof subfamily protein (haloacid dehalogenase superfamily)
MRGKISMIRLFATDLDGTLFNGGISKEDLQALERLHQAGIYVCYISGRNKLEMDMVVERVPGFSYRICQNGALVFDGRELIFEGYFAADLAKEIFRIGNESGLYCFMGTAQEMYTTADSFHYPEHMLPSGQVYDVNLEQRIGEDVLPSKFCFLGEQADLLQLQKKMRRGFPEEIDTYISGHHYLDVMPAGVDKGKGLLFLTNHLGFQPSEVAVIGDSENDIPMFELVYGFSQHSYVMRTAHAHVQAAANHVVSSVSEAVDRVLAFNKRLGS